MNSLIKILFYISLTSISLALEETYEISENGKEKTYVVSQSEFQCSPKDGGKQFIYKSENTNKSRRITSRAKLVAEDTASTVEIIIYPQNEKKTKSSRRVVSNEAYVKVKKGTSIPALVELSGANSYRTLSYTKEYIILIFENSWDCLEKTEAMKSSIKVESISPLLKKIHSKKNTPNDPLYLFSHYSTSYCWHLNNTGEYGGSAGIDVNISKVWDTYTGEGVTIGLVDDGLQTDHPDLIDNVNTEIDYNWNNGDENDPYPINDDDTHGTPCAGVAAAKGNNDKGGSGAAPNATLVGLRLTGSDVSDAQDAEAMSHESALIHVKSCSWGPTDAEGTLEEAGPLIKLAFIDSIENGRGGLGTIYLWAAGNGGDDDNVNYDGFANSIYTIAIGAVDDRGNRSHYSEPGAAKLVSASSNGGVGNQGITATQTGSSYTDSFGGTSSATPLAAGVVALMLEANPDLGWRDVQEILIKSARQINPLDSSWIINGANTPFSHEFGAGLIDAELATKLSESWTNLAPQQLHDVTTNSLPLSIPDNNDNGQSVDFTVSAGDNFRVEHVTLTADITHPDNGDLTISLTSPAGTKSILGTSGTLTEGGFSDWTFMSVFNWGESSEGIWTLTVIDSKNSKTGTLNSASLKIYGAPIQTVSSAPAFFNSTNTSEDGGTKFHFKASADNKVTNYSAADLPSGLSIDATTGAITGTVNTPGIYSVTLTATNAIGATDSSLEITIIDADDRSPRLNSPEYVTAILAEPFSYEISADFSPTSYSATSLPVGLTLDTSTGIISGTPTVSGFTQSTISAVNDVGVNSITLTIYVAESIIRSYADALDNDQLSYVADNLDLKDQTTIWNYQTDVFQVDNDALESPPLDHDESTSFSIVITEPGVVVNFWVKTSTEADFDYLSVTNSNNDELLKLSGENDWTEYKLLIKEATTLTWTYSKDDEENFGDDRVWVDSFSISSYESIIAEALDFKGLDWPDDLSLILDKEHTHDGVDALRFPPISDDEVYSLELNIVGPGILTFFYKVSTESEYDYFKFKVDGDRYINDSGDTGWKEHTQALSSGTHTLKWIYKKDDGESDNLDTVFLDKLSWVRNDYSHYQNWKLTHFTPSENEKTTISGDSSDPDADGITNLLEYAMGNSPDSSINAHNISYSANQSEISIEFPFDTNATGVDLIGQYSLNLSNWFTRTHSVINTNDNVEMRKISYPFDETKAFLRIKVLLVP